MLEIQSIHKAFKGHNILTDVSLRVEPKELIHIKGINGSGKTTLLKIIAGLLKPESGHIKLKQGVRVGALIENPTFIESESFAFNMKFLYTLTQKYNEDAVKQFANLFLLDYHLKTPIKKYSLGMRQKAGIIQAIMEDQNLILFDEPTRGLDIDSIAIFNTLVKKLLEEEKSIIVCAHDGIDTFAFTKRYEIKNGNLFQNNTY